MMSEFGNVTAILARADLVRYLDLIKMTSEFEQLRSPKINNLYGSKAMAVPALVSYLMTELKLDKAVLVPQKLTTGFILSKLASMRASSGAGAATGK